MDPLKEMKQIYIYAHKERHSYQCGFQLYFIIGSKGPYVNKNKSSLPNFCIISISSFLTHILVMTFYQRKINQCCLLHTKDNVNTLTLYKVRTLQLGIGKQLILNSITKASILIRKNLRCANFENTLYKVSRPLTHHKQNKALL